jgi:hypothetical protein
MIYPDLIFLGWIMFLHLEGRFSAPRPPFLLILLLQLSKRRVWTFFHTLLFDNNFYLADSSGKRQNSISESVMTYSEDSIREVSDLNFLYDRAVQKESIFDIHPPVGF